MSKHARRALALGCVALISLLCLEASAATITSTADGSWTDTGTWAGGVVPSSTDDVVILNNVSLSGAASIAGIDIQAGTLSHTAAALTVTGDFTVGAGAYSSSAGSSVVFAGSGLQTISGTAAFSLLSIQNTAPAPDDSSAVVSTGGVSTTMQVNIQDGQFMPTTGDSFRNIAIFSGGILKPTAGATIVVSGADGGSSLNLQSGGAMDPNGSTFRFTSATGGGVYGGTFHDIEVDSPSATPDNSNDIHISGFTTVSGTVLVTDGQGSIETAQVNHVTVGANGVLKLFTGKIAGNLTNTAGGQVIAEPFSLPEFNGSGAQLIDGPAQFEGLSIRNTSASPGDASAVSTTGQIAVARNVNVNDGQFMPTTGDSFRNIAIFSGGILKPAAGATIVVSGSDGADSLRMSTGGAMDPNGSTFRFTSATGGGVYGGTFHDVEVDSAAATPSNSNDIYISGNSTVAGTVIVTDGQGSIDTAQANHVTVGANGVLKLFNGKIAGDLTNTAGGSVIAESFSLPEFNGTGAQLIDGPMLLEGLSIRNTAASPGDSSAVSTTGGLTLARQLNVNDGQFMPATGDSFAYITVFSGGILKPAAGATVVVTGANSGTSFSLATGGALTANGSTFRFASSSSQGIFGTTATFHNVEIVNTAASPGPSNQVSIGDLAIAGTLDVQDGRVALASVMAKDVQVAANGIVVGLLGGSPTITGDLVNNGSVNLTVSGSVTFNGGTVQSLTTGTPIAFPNLHVSTGTVLDENGSADSTATTINLAGTAVLRRSLGVSGTGALTGGLTKANLNVVTQGTLATIAIDRIGSVPNAGTGHVAGASWTFDVAGATGHVVDVTLPHSLGTPADAAVSRYIGPGTTWDYVQDSVTANTVTRTGIADLSSVWALANFATVPVELDAYSVE